MNGTAVNVVRHPADNADYHLDNFTFIFDAQTEQMTTVEVKDGQGLVAVTFTISKAFTT